MEQKNRERSAARFDPQANMSRWILKAANSLVNLIVILCLCAACLYAAFALWDNHRIYAAAENVQAELLQFKPTVEEDGSASFAELLKINPDVCAWVTLDNTKIDYPVLQGSTNLTYVNQDVYGNFALAGSIFLDTRNNRDFSDAYSLLYGHHMERSGMFGDLDLYKEQKFFKENSSGMLILPDRAYELEIFACLVTDAGEETIFDPDHWQADIDGLLSYAKDNSLHLRRKALEKLEQMDTPQVLAFTTCSTEFTDARTIILAAMEPYQAESQENS